MLVVVEFLEFGLKRFVLVVIVVAVSNDSGMVVSFLLVLLGW